MNDSNPQPEAHRQHNKRGMSTFWSSALAIILAIIAIALAIYTFEQYKSLKSDNDNAKVTANTTSSQQLALQSTVTSLQTRLNATQQLVSQLMQHMGNTQAQTTLSQIAYLINLAALQLNISHNTRSALHLLQMAETKIDNLNDPRLFALSKAIAEDIQALKNVPKVNLMTIISQIDALNDAIAAADVMPGPKDLHSAEQKSASDVSSADTNKNDKWYNRAWHHISGIKDLIIIRKNNPDVKPLLDTQQQILIKSAIQSKLLLAEYAAIEHNNTLFQQHLNTAEKWINKYFYDSVDRRNLLSQLNTIKNNNVNPHIPNIDSTITLLDQTLNTISNTNTTTTPPDSFSKPKTQSTIPTHKPQPKTTQPQQNTNAGVAI